MKLARQMFVGLLVVGLFVPLGFASTGESIPLRNWTVPGVEQSLEPSEDGMLGGIFVGKPSPKHKVSNATVPSKDSRFVTMPPCRVLDTRDAVGPFGGPALSPGAPGRTFNVPSSPCSGIPAASAAYSFNVTITNPAGTGWVTLYPTGAAGVPFVSTVNYVGGQTVANAAIVPAGTGGAINIYTTTATHVIVDINGYFEEGPATQLLTYASQTSVTVNSDIAVLLRTIGTFTKAAANTTLTATWSSHVKNSATFCEFQIKIDGNTPTGLSTYYGTVVDGADAPVSQTTRWTGLAAGTHTITLWVRGFATCTDNPGNFVRYVLLEEQ